MSLRNKVTLIGHTGKEVEIVNFEKGMKATVSLRKSRRNSMAQFGCFW